MEFPRGHGNVAGRKKENNQSTTREETQTMKEEKRKPEGKQASKNGQHQQSHHPLSPRKIQVCFPTKERKSPPEKGLSLSNLTAGRMKTSE